MINIVYSIISAVFYIALYFFLIMGVLKLIKIKAKRKKTKDTINKIENKVKSIAKYMWSIFMMLITMAICSICAMELIPIIYKLNYPMFGMGYAKFASYMIAICLWIMINGFRNKHDVEHESKDDNNVKEVSK